MIREKAIRPAPRLATLLVLLVVVGSRSGSSRAPPRARTFRGYSFRRESLRPRDPAGRLPHCTTERSPSAELCSAATRGRSRRRASGGSIRSAKKLRISLKTRNFRNAKIKVTMPRQPDRDRAIVGLAVRVDTPKRWRGRRLRKTRSGTERSVGVRAMASSYRMMPTTPGKPA